MYLCSLISLHELLLYRISFILAYKANCNRQQRISKCALVGRFIEGDFGQYVRRMRQPHVWGGEPELLMCSHVLQ